MIWDVFCRVVDNYGDAGVCWRLCADLAQRGHAVRLWIDDATPLSWMAPAQTNVQVLPWALAEQQGAFEGLKRPDVVLEAFGCELPHAYVQHFLSASPHPARPVWINLEYLSAENYVQRCHGLPSPVLSGPAQGAVKWFFYPGFTPETGGLLREASVLEAQTLHQRRALRKHWSGQADGGGSDDVLVSLFCYEPAPLSEWLHTLNCEGIQNKHVRLLVTPGRATKAVQSSWAPHATGAKCVHLNFLSHCSQPQFDGLLFASDLNMVRGEDSLVRALWAGQALVWNIYPQDDGAHRSKLEAFLEWLQAPPDLCQFHRIWNGLESGALPEVNIAHWRSVVQAARKRLLQQQDLCTQLIHWCMEKR